MRPRYIVLTSFLTALWGLGVAHAHRLPEMVSEVQYAKNSDGKDVTQVTHFIHAHDAMALLGQADRIDVANLDDPALLAELGKLVLDASTFSVEGTLIGSEVEGNYLFVYEEIPGRAKIVEAHGLKQLSRSWSHRVDIRGEDGAITSFTFSEVRGTKPSPNTASPAH